MRNSNGRPVLEVAGRLLQSPHRPDCYDLRDGVRCFEPDGSTVWRQRTANHKPVPPTQGDPP